MPLFLKNIAPELDIFGNRELFNFNRDPSSGESDSALTLINWFTPILNVNANSTFEFLTPAMKGFRFNHSLSTTGIFGNFNFEKYDRFGLATPLWGYSEQTDSISFFKSVSLSGLSITGNLSLNSNKITNLANGTSNSDGVNLGQLNSSITALGFSSLNTNGFLTRTAANTYVNRSLTVDSNLTISNDNGVSGNPLLGLSSNITVSSLTASGGSVSATTGTLKGNNLAVHNSGSLTVLNSVAMNNNYITGLAYPINTQDAATKLYVDSNSGGSVRSILHGYVNTGYSDAINVGDHFKFNAVAFVRGTNISLDSSSSYNISTNTSSIGRITLAAGKTYKLTASLNNVVSASYNATRWYNSDTGATLGLICGAPSPISSTDRVGSAGTVAYITTSVSNRVELRITWQPFTQIKGSEDSIGQAWFIAEEV